MLRYGMTERVKLNPSYLFTGSRHRSIATLTYCWDEPSADEIYPARAAV
jgi:hypothetical protein